MYVKSHVFREFLPLMGKEYFFPNLPLGGRIKSSFEENVYDSDNEDERDQYFASKIDYRSRFHEVPQYSDEIHKNITIIDSSNFDVVSFLSTDKRDYLLRNDNYANGDNNQVKVASLGDKKWVMICCFFCPIFSNGTVSLDLRAVSSVCSDLYDYYGGSFEMVLVFKMMEDFQFDESAFIHQLSGFPSSCLVIPFWDSHSSDLICRALGFSGRGKGLFVSVDERKVIWHKFLAYFWSYGFDAFPFTDDKTKDISSKESRQSWNCQSLENLLCCSSSMVFFKNPGGDGGLETASIEQLKQKLVGVYLCLNGDFIPMLHQIYECCKGINKAFEIVVVYFPFSTKNSDPQLFQKLINRALEKRKISWWVLPFKSWVSRRLKRLCKSPVEDELIIVGKGFVDPHGAYVIQKFGMPAYPFSRELMFQKEAERISKITLASMLVYGERDYLLRNYSGCEDKVPVASLGGKNIFVLVDHYNGHFNSIVYGPLFNYYSDMKTKDPEFEMVYVGSCPTSVPFTETPWLVCPYDIHHLDLVSKLIIAEGMFLTTVVALKKDGLVGSIQAHIHLSSRGVEAYPFDGSGLKQEVIDRFKFRYPSLPLGDM